MYILYVLIKLRYYISKFDWIINSSKNKNCNQLCNKWIKHLNSKLDCIIIVNKI